MRLQNQEDLINSFNSYLIEQTKLLKKLTIVLSILFTLMAVGLVFIPAKNSEDTIIKYIIIVFFACIAIFIVVYMFYEKKKYKPNESLIIEAIKSKNANGFFTWIYPHKIVRNQLHSYFLIFGTEKKGRYSITLKSENEFQLIESLEKIITNVSYGYSTERAKQFRKDPTSLRTRMY
jgi:preprotein translocase subunit SecG